jgi:DSF synthase
MDSASQRLDVAVSYSADSVIELPTRSHVPALSGKAAAAFAALRLSEFDLQYDAREKLLWCYFDFTGRPCFTPSVLEQSQRIQSLVRALTVEAPVEDRPVRYLVLASRRPEIWNLGGDLELFAELIRGKDRSGLERYARACCEVGYNNATLFDLPIISIALVQGEALGGGFEAALSSNVIIAERGARFGLPEILFNLFPGMGALTFLARRVGMGLAERMVLSGEIYTAEQLHQVGAIDGLAADGGGIDAVYAHIGRGGKRYHAHAALRQSRQIVQPVTFAEMMKIADLWVDAALKLADADLRKMLRLAAAQERHRARKQVAAE